MIDPILEVDDLRTEFPGRRGPVRAVDGVSLRVHAGEIVAVVGESGCGKTMLALSILRLVPDPGRTVAGRVRFEGRDVLAMDQEELRALRGAGVAMTFQDPMAALNPLTRIRSQIREAMTAHDAVPAKETAERVVSLMGQVRIPGARQRAGDYPHQLSGGMRQRVLIAMGISNGAGLLLADEPTTALDATTQMEVVGLLRKLNRDLGTAMMLITHNMALVAGLCDRVVVMYAGRIVEEGPVERIFEAPQHPYTWALLRSTPRVDVPPIERLIAIPGVPPDLAMLPMGCTFAPRCPLRELRCTESEPPLALVAEAQHARCWVLVGSGPKARLIAAPSAPAAVIAAAAVAKVPPAPSAAEDREPILRLCDVHKHFRVPGRRTIRAVEGVTLDVHPGETLGLIGESGCGKSTLARVATMLMRPTSGAVILEGQDLTSLRARQLRAIRPKIQMIFQDAFSSLDSRMRIGDIVAEPLENFGSRHADVRRRRVQELFEMVGLDADHLDRFPHQLSGGQRQRVGIARALTLKPSIVVCDEPVSALDVSIQAQIVNLLQDLQRELRLTYLFIAHDLGVVRHLCDRVAVMYLGKIVEVSAAADLYRTPQHPYTRALLDAVPVPDPRHEPARHAARLQKELPALVDGIPGGCRFHPRCPLAMVPGLCLDKEPALDRHGDSGQFAACHLAAPARTTDSAVV